MENYNLGYKGDKPIQGVFGGKPFHSFNVDADLDRIDDEACRAMATSNLDFVPNVYGDKPPEFKEDGLPLEDIRKPKVNGLNVQETRKFRYFKRQINIPWTFAIALKPNRYENRDQDLKPWSSVARKMPYTKHVIENKMGFSIVGRVMLYGSWAGSSVPIHVDEHGDGNRGKQVQHINFNPGHSRPVYVWDSISKKKIYKPEEYKFYTFNTMDYHGVDAVPFFTYTIRVDGVL